MSKSSGSKGRGRNRGSNSKRSHGRSDNHNSHGSRNRGNAQQLMDKYLALARDSVAQGDRISAENYFQHADHYHRLVSAKNETQETRRKNQEKQNGTTVANGEQSSDNISQAFTPKEQVIDEQNSQTEYAKDGKPLGDGADNVLTDDENSQGSLDSHLTLKAKKENSLEKHSYNGQDSKEDVSQEIDNQDSKL